MIQAKARGDAGKPLAVPRRSHASTGNWRNNRERGLADVAPHVSQCRERLGIGAGERGVGVLVEARERRRITARNPEGAIGHDPLDVGEMNHHLAHAPLAGGVPVGPTRLGRVPETGVALLALAGEKLEHVAPRRARAPRIRRMGRQNSSARGRS